MQGKTVAARLVLATILCALAAGPAGAQAQETISYRYDALGRLVGTTTSGSVNSGLATSISYDAAGNRQTYGVTGAGAGGGGGGGGGGSVAVADSSFENPPQNGGFAYGPTVTGVAFFNGAGVAANGSAWGFPAAPEGTQVGFLQGTSYLSMNVSGLTAGSAYTVRFWIAPRPAGGTPVTVSFNGTSLGPAFTPGQPGFLEVSTPAFTAPGATGTITFATNATTDLSTAIDAVTIVPVAAPASVANASFESPGQNGGWAMNPSVAGASFTGRSGVAGNGSAFAFAPAPEGSQVGWIQGWSSQSGAIALNVTGLTSGATYRVRFSHAQRPNYDPNPVAVSVGGVALGTYTPASTSFVEVTTAAFTATGTTATVTFSGAPSTGDIDTALDAVSVVPGP